MEAFHSFWSKPNMCKHNGEINIPDFEICTMALSALKWKELNGNIKMITDSYGACYFKDLGLDVLWNDIDISLDMVDSSIDPFLFWAAGKLYALNTMPAPCVMLDTDLILWKKLNAYPLWSVIAAHSEDLTPSVYPDKDQFCLQEGYHLPECWDYSLKASNTAFLYIQNEEFKKYYTSQALSFFKNVKPDGLNPITAMCFAEQRILPMCAKEKGETLGHIFDLSECNDQDFITHTWGFKQQMLDNSSLRNDFVAKCMNRIQREYTNFYPIIKKIIQ